MALAGLLLLAEEEPQKTDQLLNLFLVAVAFDLFVYEATRRIYTVVSSLLAMSSNVPNKRQRLESGSNDDDEEEATTSNVTLLDLPSEVFLRLVAFSDFAARMGLALTCQRTRAEVETHEKLVYETIKSEHRADETFDARVGDQSSLQTTLTGRQKPVVLPYRYRKIVAMKTALFTIRMRDEDSELAGVMVLSPSEDSIAAQCGGRRENHVYVCNLSTREHASTLVHVSTVLGDETDVCDVLYLEDHRILTISNGLILNWSADSDTAGIWMSERLHPDRDDERSFIRGMYTQWFRNGPEILSFETVDIGRESLAIKTVNIMDRSVKTRIVNTDLPDRDLWAVTIGLSNNKWLLAIVEDFAERPLIDFAYNIDTHQKCRFLSKTKDTVADFGWNPMKQASDCSRTFFAVRRNFGIVVYALGDDGYLSERLSFPAPVDYFIAASQSHVVAKSNSSVLVYNAQTGECMRTLAGVTVMAGVRGVPCVISKSRQEIYIAQNGSTIKAFCLDEPHIV